MIVHVYLYNILDSASNGSAYQYRNINSPPTSRNSRMALWMPETGKMSPVRRTFCLFVTFDLILTFILWVIYTQVSKFYLLF